MTTTRRRGRRQGIRRWGVAAAMVLGLLALVLSLSVTWSDAPTGPIIATVSTDASPLPLVIDPQRGRAVIGAFNSARVQVMDTATGRIIRTVTLPQPNYWGGNAAWDEQAGRLFILGRPQLGLVYYTISILDVQSGRLMGVVSTPPCDMAAVAIDRRTQRIFLATLSFPNVSVRTYDAASLRLLRTTTVSAPPPINTGWGASISFIAVDARTARVFVRHAESNRVGILDAADGRLVGTTALRPLSDMVNGQPEMGSLTVDEALGHVYATDIVFTLDAATGRPLWRLSTGSQALPVTPPLVDERTRLMYVFHRGRLSVLDAVSGRLLHAPTLPFSSAYVYGVVDAPTGRLFAIDGVGGAVYLIDSASGHLLRTILTGGSPGGVAVDDRSGLAVLTRLGPLDGARRPIGNGTVSVLDGRGGRVIWTASVGMSPSRGGTGAGWTAIQSFNGETSYLLVQLDKRRLHVPVIMARGAGHGASVSPHDGHSG